MAERETGGTGVVSQTTGVNPAGGAIGRSLPLADAAAHVTGETRFAADVRRPGALVGRILFARHPHARIVRLDTARAAALPGVRAVVTAADVPDRGYGLGGDRWLFARDEVRFAGDRVAAVAADDAETAERALGLIEVEYAELPVVADALAALQPGAPVARADRAWRFRERHPELGPNVAAHASGEVGDVDRAFAASDLVLEEEYRTQRIHHSYLEPRAAVAEVDAAGHVAVWTTTQGHFDCRAQIAHVLDIPLSRVRVTATAIGGGFGGKGDVIVEPIAVLLAQRARRPVRIVLTRRDELVGTQARIPTVIRIKSGVSQDGRILAREVHVVGDVGCANDVMIPDLAGGGWAQGPYRIPNVRATWTDVYTNQVPAAAFRAPRAPQACFASESHLDSLARQLGLDPLEVRRLNGPGPDDPEGSDFAETLAQAARQAGWERRERGRDEQGRLVGWGLACARWSIWASSISSAIVMVNLDGSIAVNTGSVDISGSHTSLAQIAAERLRVDVGQVVVAVGNTSLSPLADSTGGSRTVYATGAAVLAAAADALRQLAETFAEETGVPVEEVEPHAGGLRDRAGRHWRSYGVLVRFRLANGGGPVVGRGGQSALPACPVHVAEVARVAVDPETGQTSVQRLIVAQSVGQAINPASVEGQLAGGAAQGLGYALLEEHQAPAGHVLNPSLVDYRLPTALDVPAVETVLVAGQPSAGPYGARGVGEPPVIPTAAAIANAVCDATGARVRRLPLTPEVVHAALQGSPEPA